MANGVKCTWCMLALSVVILVVLLPHTWGDPAPPPWPRKNANSRERDNELVPKGSPNGRNGHFVGPNVCRTRSNKTQCCPGWSTKQNTNLCIVPICNRNCSSTGRCVSPNICICEGGFEGPSCNPNSVSNFHNRIRGGCKRICMNGGTCVNATCKCAPGWDGEFCTIPICREPCLHDGRCIAPDRCACFHGLSGKRCEIDRRTGPCYTDIRGSLCTNSLEGVSCTKGLCCASVGRYWGHPCEPCPSDMDCERGFLKNLTSGECQDIDECAAIPFLCGGGKCENSIGSFSCHCPPGQTRSLETNNCEDKNECEDENICRNGKCINTDGSYYCLCDPHFIQSPDKRFCVDGRLGTCYIDRSPRGECSGALSVRLSNRDCCCGKNMGKGWGDYCEPCPQMGEPDYQGLCFWTNHRGVNSSYDTKSLAFNRNGFNGTNDHGNGYPNGNGGSYWSIDHPYHPTPPPIDYYKVNECMLRRDICGLGRCNDTEDGYECECFKGAELDDSDDRPVCVDINECERGYCQGGNCTNYNLSFVCICPTGFDISTDGRRCSDQDECSISGKCANGICTMVDGSLKCQCKSGFKLSGTGRACMDIDECHENPRICLNGKCDNSLGSYKCQCDLGFIESEDKAFCVDLNECDNTGMCEHGKCVNVEGSFQCVCDSGYRIGLDRRHCVDIDECLSSPCQHGKCYNTLGSFRCECAPGFNLGKDGRSCLDENKDLCFMEYKDGKCSNPTEFPVSKSTCCCCTVVIGQPMGWGTNCQSCPMIGTEEFDLLCPFGTGKTFTGVDINECNQDPNICRNGACENLMGSYRCICNPGYQVDDSGKICVDINECEIEKMLCYGGRCRNTPGSYQCICPPGTRHDTVLQTCEDIDECEESDEVLYEDRDPGNSSTGLDEPCAHGTCVNTLGSYDCICDEGYLLDNTGRVCIDNRRSSCWTRYSNGVCEMSLPYLVLKQECCCSLGMAWGSPCEQCDFSLCGCPVGFAKLDGKTCSDINECSLNVNVCQGGGACANTEGSYVCSCPPGLTLDSTGTQCVDRRREVCYAEYKRGQCGVALHGLFNKSSCCCSPVGKAWGSDRCDACPRPGSAAFKELCPGGEGFISKTDINECVMFPGLCSNGHCRNTIGSFVCNCSRGFDLDESKVKCNDINECEIVQGVCGNGTCHNLDGTFRCDCDEGYVSSNMMQVCTDIDECTDIPGICPGGSCENTIGSYKCHCPLGHELTPDGKACKDIDECSKGGICSHGVCENMMGAYLCNCDAGYTQINNKLHCKDIDECSENNGDCDSGCLNTEGSYQCTCSPGYALQQDGKSCKDIDECVETPRVCGGGKCTNTLGDYECDCSNGFVKHLKTCQDLDECAWKPSICNKGECINTVGSYTCNCEDGYSVKPDISLECTDDDECFMRTDNCHEFADCINLPGSFQCRCKDGFTGNGVDCQDINECLTNNGGCHPNAQCINNDGSFHCACDPGFKGNGYSCVDIDECSNDANLCENGHCINLPGSFQCECEMGFMPPDDTNFQSCQDINECQMFNNLCVYGRCENLYGMFTCHCTEGFRVDDTGGNCTDIDECLSPQSCLYGTCNNTHGSYRCECPPDYELVDGNACVDRRVSRCYQSYSYDPRLDRNRCSEPLNMYEDVTRASCCCSVGQAWGPRCQACPPIDSEEYKQLCPGGPGYKPNTITVVLEDIQECDEYANLCMSGHCTNTFGSFVCSCNEGYRLDDTNTRCLDIDECAENYDICGAGYCRNLDGSYMCICPEGYMTMPSGKECVDTRREQCYLNYAEGECSSPMSQEQTFMVCCCSMGKAWGLRCDTLCPTMGTHEYVVLCGTKPGQIMNRMTNETEEIDECTLMGSMCKNGKCIDTPGSFECHCNRGFIYDEESHQCRDDNECLRFPNPCQGNAQCINLEGHYECRCPEGYKLGPGMKNCVDIDECLERPGVCTNGDCKNLQGSFQCLCKPGYYLTPHKDNCLDVDECQRHQNVCKNGTCYNTAGSYVCQCHDGFKLSPNNDCIDVDECKIMPYLCRNGRCINTVGAFICRCADGYSLTQDQKHCTDIDECQETPGLCPYPGKCHNTMGSYSCSCPLGYRANTTRGRCEDINECLERGNVCEDGECTNREGGFLCTCPDGWINSKDGMNCVDKRKEYCYDSYNSGICDLPRPNPVSLMDCCCAHGNPAAWGRYCQPCPIPGSEEFRKMCPGGMGHNSIGVDIDECKVNPGICKGGGGCINTDGAFRCECPHGYVLDATGTTCIDDNECVSNPTICGNGTCININGGFECNCNSGYISGPMQICEDVNECQELDHSCMYRCHNVPGSYRCTCPKGFALAPDGFHCEDVDECRTPANKCKHACKNLIGSYQCTCKPGFKWIGTEDECVDIDECATNQGKLCTNGRCMNTHGSFYCECDQGYRFSDISQSCVDTRVGPCYILEGGECRTEPPTHVSWGECCCSYGEAWGYYCETCPEPDTPQYRKLCVNRGTFINETGIQDINECEIVPNVCEHGNCLNMHGSYKCSCNRGYKVDVTGTSCVDVNECHQRPSPCQERCVNTLGSYTCACPPGYELNPDGVTCGDIDECELKTHTCHHECINTEGSYQCACKEGYDQQGDSCIDINECELGICQPPGNCMNTLGSYKCICPRGYKLDSSGMYCIDQNECADDKCDSNCINLIGGYRCNCPQGYVPHPSQKTCVDEDECSSNPCGGLGHCFNVQGSYRCGCPDGYQFDEVHQVCLQVSSACVGSPCFFGCTAIGTGGYTCGCPQGYHIVGQGHCLSTIDGQFGPDDFGNAPIYPISDDLNRRSKDHKIISSEGCFSCKMNNRRHRRHMHHHNATDPSHIPSGLDSTMESHQMGSGSNSVEGGSSAYPAFIDRVLRKRGIESAEMVEGTTEKIRRRRRGHGKKGGKKKQRNVEQEHVAVKLELSQTKRKSEIIKIRPSVKDIDVVYRITKGNEMKKLRLVKMYGIWSLHFKKALKEPESFNIEIEGRLPKDRATDNSYEKPLKLYVNIEVV